MLLLALVATSYPLYESLDAEIDSVAPKYSYKVLETYPHRASAWTEGLTFLNGKLLESTGPNNSRFGGELCTVSLPGGEATLDAKYTDIYGEGVTHIQGMTYVLSWQEHKIKTFQGENFKFTGDHPLATEGWGATTDGQRYIYSDGTPTIRFMDPKTLQVIGQIQVTQDGLPIQQLNELEWVKGEIWANVWQTYKIVRINPNTGDVNSWVDLSGIHPRTDDGGANGIAYDKSSDTLIVTGKHWNKMFKIEAVLAQ